MPTLIRNTFLAAVLSATAAAASGCDLAWILGTALVIGFCAAVITVCVLAIEAADRRAAHHVREPLSHVSRIEPTEGRRR